jgi:hypothetical protein
VVLRWRVLGREFSAAKSCTDKGYAEQGARALNQGVRGEDRASTAAGGGRGRNGHSGDLVESVLSAEKRKMSGTNLLTTRRCFKNIHGRGRSSGGSDQGWRQIGRRSGGREQEPHVLHDPVKMLLDKKRHVGDMITPEKEKIEAKKHITDGVRRQ